MADTQHSLVTYVSDMLALEEHISVPLGAQRADEDFSKYPEAQQIVERVNALCGTHVQALRSALDALGGHEAAAAKTVVANIEGWFASALDMMRKTKVAKALRDDYTALSLCAVSYSMLLTTANAFGDPRVAQLAQRHLQDYARAIMQIGEAMPAIVVEDLQQTGIDASTAQVEPSRRAIASAWRSSAEAQSNTISGTIESDAAANRRASPTYPTA